MAKNRSSKNWNSRSVFKKFSATLTALPLLASSGLNVAAFAGNDGMNFKQFKLDNPGFDNKQLHQMFREQIREQRFDTNNDARDIGSISNGNGNVSMSIAPDSSANFANAALSHTEHLPKIHNQVHAVKEPKNHNQTLQQANGRFISVNGGLALDLASAAETITLGDKLFQGQSAVTINVGGVEKTVSAGSKVTAAEYVAAKQAIAGTLQTVQLDAEGRATGGSVDLSALDTGNRATKITNLTVPVSVTASGDFAKNGDVRIKGDLINSGSIEALSSDSHLSALVSARNITNNAGASINSSVESLTLEAERNFNNFGSITSERNLTVAAQRGLNNSGTITAHKDLTVLSPKVTNTGSLVSLDENVNLGTAIPATLAINNAGGTIRALDGAINLRSQDYCASFNTTLSGGDLFSKDLNVYTGQGIATVAVKELTGTVNTTGSGAHVSADTGTLTLGTQNLSGDPTYFNTGDITIGGDLIVGEKLAIIAGGNISTSQSSLTIKAQDLGGQGQDIFIVAGANVTGTGSSFPNPATTASFSGVSATGGSINLTSVSSVSTIDASGASGNTNAGNITLAAFANGANGGEILLGNNWGINASGQGSGTNGNINVIAGKTSATAINLGLVQNTGGSGVGSISVINAQPVLSSGTSIDFNSLGAITSGNTLVASGTLGSGSIQIGAITASGDVDVFGSSIMNIGAVNGLNGGTLTVDTQSVLTIGNINGAATTPGKVAGSVSLTAATIATGDIDVHSDQANVTAGRVAIQAQNVIIGDINAAHTTTTGHAGSIAIATGTSTSLEAGTGSAGSNRVGTLDVGASAGGNGGVITLINNSGGIKLTSAPVLAVAEGDGSTLYMDGVGTVDLSGAGTTISVNAGTGLGQSHNGGSIHITGNTLATASPTTLTANATGSGIGGEIEVEQRTGNISLDNASGLFSTLSASGVFGSVKVESAGSLTVANTAAISAEDISLESSTPGMTIGLGINSTGTIDLRSTGTITVNTSMGSVNQKEISINTPSLTLANLVNLRADRIDIASPVGLGLTVTGNGGTGGSFTTTQGTYVTASASTLTLTGRLAFLGTNSGAILSAGGIGQSINATGLLLGLATAPSALISNTISGGNFITSGTGIWIAGTSGAFNNSTGGTLKLTGNMSFSGGNIALVSSGDIDLSGVTLNTTGTTNGGALTMLAGYNFSGGFTSTTNYSTASIFNLSANATGGSIIGTPDLLADAQNGNAGKVTLVANGGSNSGSGLIDVGSISATGTNGAGGLVTVIAENGITVGSIDTTGTTSSGNVNLAIASAVLPGSFAINSGNPNGQITSGAATAGNLSVGLIQAGSATVNLTGALGVSDTLSVTGLVQAGTIALNAGAGASSFASASAANFSSTSNGAVSFTNTGALSLGTLSGTQSLTVVAGGAVTGGSGSVTNLNVTGSNSAGNTAVQLGAVSVTNNATLTSTGGGNVMGALNAGNSLTIVSSGDIGASGNSFSTNAATISASAANSIFLASTSTSDVSLTVGGLASNGTLSVAGQGNLTLLGTVNADTVSIINVGNLTVSNALSARDISLIGDVLTLPATVTALTDGVGNGGSIGLNCNTLAASAGHISFVAQGTGVGAGGQFVLSVGNTQALDVSDAGIFSVDAHATGTGNGGQITVNSVGDATYGNNAINATGGADGGFVNLNSNRGMTINFNAINAGGADGDGAQILLLVNNALSLNDTSFLPQVNGTGSSGDGGNLVLNAGDIIVAGNSSANPMVLQARGSGTGSGGEIEITKNSASTIFVGAVTGKAPRPPVLFLSADARSGLLGGNGGKIDIHNGGAMNVNMSGALAGPVDTVGSWDGADYTFAAGNTSAGKALIVIGSIDGRGVNGGSGGDIRLESDNSSSFTIGAVKAPRNGVLGSVITNGDVRIENNAGGVFFQTNALSAANLDIFANGKGAISAAAGVTLDVPGDVHLTAFNGNIGGKVPLRVLASNLSASTNGLVGIQNLNSANWELENSFGGKGFTLTTVGTVTVNNISTTAGSILITNGFGQLEVADGATLTANSGALTLQNLDLAGSIRVGTGSTVQTLGKGRNVTLVIGATIPKTGTNPTPPGLEPLGITANATAGNFIFFGAPGSVVAENPSGNANVQAKNVNVVFSGANPGSIIIGENSLIFADPPAPSQQTFDSTGASSDSFGLVGEKATYTADLSFSNLNGTAGQISNNGTLVPMGASAGMADIRLSSDQPMEDNSYAVGFCPTTNAAGGSICSDWQFTEGDSFNGIPVVEHQERVSLGAGAVLFVPMKPMTVETVHGVVRIDARSVVLISCNDAGLAVYDLDDQHKAAVTVESEGQVFALAPGRHVMVTPHSEAEFAQVNSVETIAHRNLSSVAMNKCKAHSSEFSVLSAIDSVKPLKALAASTHPQARQIAGKMLKTAAIVLHLSNSNNQYQHYFKPRLTAMNK